MKIANSENTRTSALNAAPIVLCTSSPEGVATCDLLHHPPRTSALNAALTLAAPTARCLLISGATASI
ncbi:MAG: hypothetical protein GVY30_08300 [Chloroflexi bacterium]|nr:hypothetical protein [Chloroflexota bacterium]